MELLFDPNPNADGHPPLSRILIPRNRGRFSFKERMRKIVHDPLPKAKQFKLKAYCEPAQSNDLDKNGLVRSMNWHQPISSLETGTVRANVGRVVMDGVAGTDTRTEERQEVVDCLQEAPRLAASVKREAQRLIGQFVEMLRDRMDQVEEERRIILESMTPPQTMAEFYRLQCRKDSITEAERGILLSICERVKPADIAKDEEDAGDGNKVNDDSDVANRQDKDSAQGHEGQGHSTKEANIQIQPDVSAVENFLYLNKLTGNSRRMVPITSSTQPFVTFSERELAAFFWKRKVLKERLVELGKLDNMTINSMKNLDAWIAGKETGYTIKTFVADVAPQGLTSRQRKRAGHRSAVKLWSLDQTRSHLADVQNEWLDPTTYATKGYVLQGSLKTDGFRIQLLAHKLRELQDVRFHRIAEDRLPSRLTSTVGGIDYFLPEIRNVITSTDDVAKYWPGFQPKEIKTLTLDGGKACVTGAFADIPDDPLRTGNGKEVDRVTSSMEGNIATSETSTSSISLPIPTSVLTQDQQRATSPLGEKQTLLNEGEEQRTIAGIETELPPLKGEGASVIKYLAELKRVEERLLEFYAG
ncbi:hypothetical protein BG004_006508 [Podila humilis]|nr:hypothetical protein BG004_006508 [Podila humilis]